MSACGAVPWPRHAGPAVAPYLPVNAAFTVATSTFEDRHHLSTWGGFAVFCGYTALVVAAGALRLARSDA